MTERVTITRLGAKGEGIAETAQGRVFVPYALPGETVGIDREGERGTLIGLIQPSPLRIEPCCSYFTTCGGCAVQTLAPAPYAEWKRGLLVAALAQAKVAVEVAPLVDAHGLGRRRATFHARTADDGRTRVGFMQARSHDIVAIEACPILAPAMAGAIPAARAIAKVLAGIGKPADILVTATDTGLDVDLRGPGKLAETFQRRLADIAVTHDLARLSNHGTIILERRRPILRMGEALLEPPAGAFLQATEAGEVAIARRVLAALNGAKRVADLFAGVGTFALRLADHAEVSAYDTERPALEALAKASRALGLRTVKTEARDLFHRPLLPEELAAFDAVALDPPRAGAEAQTRQIAASTLSLVVSVACDAQSFARDAAILIAAGFRPDRAEPIDQFRFSPHMEVVCVFRRDPARKKRRLLG